MNQQVRPIALGAFPVHDLAALVPIATPPEQIALTEDIKANGQREPIVLWKGAIVDGRCRQKALLLLKHPIIYKELDDDLSYSEVAIWVKSANTRRNLTMTQKQAIAAKEYIKGHLSKEKVATNWGVGASLLKNTIWLAKEFPDVIEDLFNGLGVEITDQKGKTYFSDKITSIYAYYKKEREQVKEDTEHAWKDGTNIKTQIGKDWYYSKIKGKTLDAEIKLDYEELANYKFPPNQ